MIKPIYAIGPDGEKHIYKQIGKMFFRIYGLSPRDVMTKCYVCEDDTEEIYYRFCLVGEMVEQTPVYVIDTVCHTAVAESGDFIDEFLSYDEAAAAIEAYETADKKEGIYLPDYYEVENDEHLKVIGETEYGLILAGDE